MSAASGTLATRACDVAVIGAGPAGTTAATLLARRGWAVTVFEKDRHPRFHIGESLLPMNVPLFERLDVLDAVRAIGVYKPAADFTGRNRRDHHTFPFANALGRSPDHAFQVVREELDLLLADNCRRAGASLLEDHRVARVELGGAGVQLLHVEHEGGVSVWRCRYVVDASGQDTVLARQQGWRTRDRRHSAAAFFAHYRGVPPRAGAQAGNISIYWFEQGWIWMIPLKGGITSIGAVCGSEFVRARRNRAGSGTQEDLLEQVLAACPAAAERLAGAERTAPVRSAANYSYGCTRHTGAGFRPRRRCLHLRGPGVFQRRLPRHDRRRVTGPIRGALAGRAAAALPAVEPGLPPPDAAWDPRLQVVHLPLQHPRHGLAVREPAQCPGGGTGGGVSARRRCLRGLEHPPAAGRVQGPLRDGGCPSAPGTGPDDGGGGRRPPGPDDDSPAEGVASGEPSAIEISDRATSPASPEPPTAPDARGGDRLSARRDPSADDSVRASACPPSDRW